METNHITNNFKNLELDWKKKIKKIMVCSANVIQTEVDKCGVYKKKPLSIKVSIKHIKKFYKLHSTTLRSHGNSFINWRHIFQK